MLTPIFDHEIPEMTTEIAHGAFPKGNVIMKIRDTLGPIFEDGLAGANEQKGAVTSSISPYLLTMLSGYTHQRKPYLFA
jgi:hypothetical protein